MDVQSDKSAGELIQLLEAGQVESFLREFFEQPEDDYADICTDVDGDDYHFLEEEYGGCKVNALREALWWSDHHKDEPYYSIDGVRLLIEEEQGGDGDGSLITLILKVERNGKNVCFIRMEAYHSSYETTTWELDQAELVEPRQVMVTKYFALDGSDDE